jgi:hypothetical protein
MILKTWFRVDILWKCMAFNLQSAIRLLISAKAVPDHETRIKHQNNSTTTQGHDLGAAPEARI